MPIASLCARVAVVRQPCAHPPAGSYDRCTRRPPQRGASRAPPPTPSLPWAIVMVDKWQEHLHHVLPGS
eukprot:scaffold1056_cov564-Prasinococcus_capsulatus_cf.AAC.8